VSGSAGFSSAPLAEAERVDIRRFCGYPAIGSEASGEGSWRFFQVYGSFEWRIGNLSASELMQVRLYLSQLYPLELAVPGASATLDTAQAASWRRNANEVRDRLALYDVWRRRLCGFLGVPLGPDLEGDAAIIV